MYPESRVSFCDERFTRAERPSGGEAEADEKIRRHRRRAHRSAHAVRAEKTPRLGASRHLGEL